MKVFLSYQLDPADLVWPGEPNLEIRQCTEIGVSEKLYNSYQLTLPDHVGTHYDAPNHFNPNGPKIGELPVEYFWFENICVIDAPKNAKEGVTKEDLIPYEAEIKKADLLLIKTGFAQVRRDSPEIYQMEGPFLYPETCRYMVETFKDLKSVGFDFLSLGSPCNDLAADAHQIILGCFTDNFITVIEDMDLRPLYETQKKLRRVVAAPLKAVGLDSGQVSVIGEFEE